MVDTSSSRAAPSRLERLLGYLKTDPANQSLLLQTAEAACDEQDLEQAAELIERARRVAPLPPSARNLEGVVLLGQQKFAEAQSVFEQLGTDGADGPGVRFNLAWALAMQNLFEACVALLDDEVMSASPRAPALKVQALHHLQRHEEAMAIGVELVAAFPENSALHGSLAMLAMDVEDEDAARRFAALAGNDPDGVSVRGLLALSEGKVEHASHLFSDALAKRPQHARAWVGQGLALLSAGDPAAGAKAIDRGAEIFGNHVGSWVASGWANRVAGNMAAARASFERGLSVDANFSEVHGGLAVLDLEAGDVDSALRRTETALRLDRSSFGGLLAKMMLMEREGDRAGAERLRSTALRVPIGTDGRTLLDAMKAFGTHQRR